MDPALIVAGPLNGARLNAEYGEQLTIDLTEEHKVMRASADGHHPGWLLSHMNLYLPVAAAMARGETPADPKGHPHGIGSPVLDDPSAYAPLSELRETFAAGHAEAEAALRAATLDVLSAPPPVERWQSRFASAAEMLSYLLVRHESLHLGQLSAWRRSMGLPRV